MPSPYFSGTDDKFHTQGDVKTKVVWFESAPANNSVVPVFRATYAAEIVGWHALAMATVAGTVNLVLEDGGAAGTATTAVGGGTLTFASAAAGSALAGTLGSTKTVAAGDWVVLAVTTSGSPAAGSLAVAVDWVNRDV